MIYDWLPEKKLVRIDSPNGRKYQTPDGNKYESVTTFLGKHSKQAIIDWRKRVGEKEANRISAQASSRGTKLHNLVESHLKGSEVAFDNFLIKDLFKRFLPVVSKIDNIKAIEYNLYSDTLKLAGTVDCIAEYDGVLSVIDFKTSSKTKEKHFIEDYFLQCAIYSLMVEELYGIKIPQIAILIAVENEAPQVFIEQRKNYFNSLQQRLATR